MKTSEIIFYFLNEELAKGYHDNDCMFLVESEYQADGIRLWKNKDLHKKSTNGKIDYRLKGQVKVF